jgi:hypothetical protein
VIGTDWRPITGLFACGEMIGGTRPRPDEESLFEQKRSEMTACDQRLEVPFDSIGDQGAGHSDPDLDVAQCSLGQQAPKTPPSSQAGTAPTGRCAISTSRAI